MTLKGCICVDDSCVEKAEMKVTPNDNSKEEEEVVVVGGEEIAFVNQISNLAMIQKDVVQLVVFRQKENKILTLLEDDLSKIQPSNLPSFEGIVTPDSVKETIQSIFYPRYKLRSKKHSIMNDDDDMKQALIDDIYQLVRIFADISQSDSVFLKLEVVQDNACAFWHQDCVEFRLVKTYLGPCTEWVAPTHSKATLRQRQNNSQHSQSFSPGDAALFKGRGDTADSDDEYFNHPGIVHRSPRIKEGSGTFRFVLVLDVPQEGWHY